MANDNARNKRDQKTQTTKDQGADPVLEKLVHLQLKTGQKHDVQNTDGGEEFHTLSAFEDVEAVWSDQQTTDDQTYDPRDLQLAKGHRRQQEDEQDQSEDGHRMVQWQFECGRQEHNGNIPKSCEYFCCTKRISGCRICLDPKEEKEGSGSHRAWVYLHGISHDFRSRSPMGSIDQREDSLHDSDHHSSSPDTPLRADAFALSDEEKKKRIREHFTGIMDTLGLDLSDDSLQGTPKRVAEMMVDELFAGLKADKMPKMSTFENKYRYGEMLVEKNIVVYSTCEHHFLPIVGRAHLAYISKGQVIGLSKMNRLVDHFAKRPQVQERMTRQIVNAMQKALGTEDVACVVDAKHLCVNSRGIRDIDSSTVTAEYGGVFQEESVKREFLQFIQLETDFNSL